MSFVAIIVVSSKPEVILLPKCRYNSPKHCVAPTNLKQKHKKQFERFKSYKKRKIKTLKNMRSRLLMRITFLGLGLCL